MRDAQLAKNNWKKDLIFYFYDILRIITPTVGFSKLFQLSFTKCHKRFHEQMHYLYLINYMVVKNLTF